MVNQIIFKLLRKAICIRDIEGIFRPYWNDCFIKSAINLDWCRVNPRDDIVRFGIMLIFIASLVTVLFTMFVSRAKSNMDYSVVEQNFNIDPASGLRTDRTVTLNGHRSKKLYSGPLRLVEYHDREGDVDLLFLTNNMEVSSLEVAKLYRNRWQIETFFKWIKQNLAIKKLWGYSENAVNIHIWVAICTYLVVAHLKHSLKSELSIYEIIQILGISAIDKTPLQELLTEPKSNQHVNEQMNLFSD